LLTQASTAGVITTAADIIAQQCVEQRGINSHDFLRSARLGAIGFLFTGPILRFWYLQLDKLVPGAQNIVGTAKRITLDQTIFAPVFLGGFLTVLGITDGKSSQQIWDKLYQDYPQVLRSNYMLWPAAQIITFTVVPLQHRVGFVSLVALFWNTYLTWVAHRH
jgi:protein Mpv17